MVAAVDRGEIDPFCFRCANARINHDGAPKFVTDPAQYGELTKAGLLVPYARFIETLNRHFGKR